MNKIKVLLVDDSGFMRIVLSDIINNYSDMQVIDTATNGKEGYEKTVMLSPDVVLLDITMQDYDGLYAIEHIMKNKPTPIVVLSSIRTSNPGIVIDALNAGAVDFIDKPQGTTGSTIRDIDGQIYRKIKQASTIDKSILTSKKIGHNTNRHTFDRELNYQILAIGASTGGTGAIEQLLTNLPENMPIPIVIGQHMPADFIFSFAERLDKLLKMPVKVTSDGMRIEPGNIYILAGDTNTKIVRKSKYDIVFQFTSSQYKEYNNPSIDCMMESVAEVYGSKALAIILTGMGRDGCFGISKIYDKGGYTIAQDEKTSIVYGMPRAVKEAGVAKQVLSLKDMPSFVVSALA